MHFPISTQTMPLHLLFLLSLLTSTNPSCDPPHRLLLSLAFSTVAGFHPPPLSGTSACIRHLHLPSQNLSGTISWMFLRNITTLQSIDLSGNTLHGSIPGSFWSSPSLDNITLAGNRFGGPLRFERSGLRSLDLSGNRFTAISNLSQLADLKSLDLSSNQLVVTPQGLNLLSDIEFLDISNNSMVGEFPKDFPMIDKILFLNVSFNNLSGEVDLPVLIKFGSSAFTKTSIHTRESSSREEKKVAGNKKMPNWKKGVIAGAAAIAGVITVMAGIAGALYRRKRSPEKETGEGAGKEDEWVREARWGAGVVLFEKPLMELTFGDLATATSRFGRESLMAEGGRNGPVYRAVLPGDLNVVVRVMVRDRSVEAPAATSAYKEIGRLRHPNLLPLLGYCISGREKLLLYEYMERGDLHRWLHELPAGQPHIEGSVGDAPPAIIGSWPMRHRLALGIARGLAFLHQGWVGSHSPAVHGHLVPSNILLSDNFEPRIADFAAASRDGGGFSAAAEDDVYSYGVLVMELVTGRSHWPDEEVERFRGVLRADQAVGAIDRRLQLEGEWEKEAAECLKVVYLCTAKLPEKRPTMGQVVALLKDIRHVDVISNEMFESIM